MFGTNFSLAHRFFVRNFIDWGLEKAIEELDFLERYITDPSQQAAHDDLVEAVYKLFPEEAEVFEFEIIL